MPLLDGIQVWLEVDGRPLVEFKESVNMSIDHRRVTCFIASEADKHFEIAFRNQNARWSQTSVRGNVYLDGRYMGAGLLMQGDERTLRISGHARTEGLEMRYKFDNLKLTDDEYDSEQNSKIISEIGTIRVRMEHVSTAQEESFTVPPPVSQVKPIHETHKKAGSHCTTLGEAVPVARRKCWYKTVKVPYMPEFEFVFSYAPQGWLQAKGVIERGVETRQRPSTTASSSNIKSEDRRTAIKREPSAEADNSGDSDVTALTAEEATAYKALKEKMRIRNRKKVKVEPLVLPPGTFTPGEVIDLTLDD